MMCEGGKRERRLGSERIYDKHVQCIVGAERVRTLMMRARV